MNLLKQSFVKYGLLMNLSILVCLAWMEISGQNESFEKNPVFMVPQFIWPAIVLWLGIGEKKKQLNGKLNFKQGLREGFKISLVFGLTSPFVFLAYYTFFNPGIVDYAAQAYGMTGSDRSVVIMVDMLVQLIAAVIFGSIYSAVISFFLKSKS